MGILGGHLTVESLPDKVWVGAVWDRQVKGRVQDPIVLDSWAVHLSSATQMNQDRCQGSGMGISKDGFSFFTFVALGKVARDFFHVNVAAPCLRNSLTPLDRQGILRESF